MQRVISEKIEGKTGLASMVGIAKGNFKSVQEVDNYINKLRDEWE